MVILTFTRNHSEVELRSKASYLVDEPKAKWFEDNVHRLRPLQSVNSVALNGRLQLGIKETQDPSVNIHIQCHYVANPTSVCSKHPLFFTYSISRCYSTPLKVVTVIIVGLL